MYDPLVGRFLSPDNIIQSPDNTQNYNRYTYCLNNPLKYNDPSGWLMCPGSGGFTYSPTNMVDFGGHSSEELNNNNGGGGGWGGNGGVLPAGYPTAGSSFGEQLYNAANGLLGSISENVVYRLTGIGYSNGSYEFTFGINAIATQFMQQVAICAQKNANFQRSMALASASNIGYGESFGGKDPPSGWQFYTKVNGDITLGSQAAFDLNAVWGFNASLGDRSIWSYSATSDDGETDTSGQLRYRLGATYGIVSLDYQYNQTINEAEVSFNFLLIFNIRYRTNGPNVFDLLNRKDLYLGPNIGGRIAAVWGIEGDIRWGALYKW